MYESILSSGALHNKRVYYVAIGRYCAVRIQRDIGTALLTVILSD